MGGVTPTWKPEGGHCCCCDYDYYYYYIATRTTTRTSCFWLVFDGLNLEVQAIINLVLEVLLLRRLLLSLLLLLLPLSLAPLLLFFLTLLLPLDPTPTLPSATVMLPPYCHCACYGIYYDDRYINGWCGDRRQLAGGRVICLFPLQLAGWTCRLPAEET